ncbi:hypothetical protein GCM10027615_68800 [Plantactinospora veratri]
MSVGAGRIVFVLVAVVRDEDGDGGLLQPLHPDGRPAGPAERVADLGAAVADREAARGQGVRRAGSGPPPPRPIRGCCARGTGWSAATTSS